MRERDMHLAVAALVAAAGCCALSACDVGETGTEGGAQPASPKRRTPARDLSLGRRFQQWGDESMAAIRRDFWLADRKLYAEHSASPNEKNRQPAFMWGCGVQLSALAAAARVDPDQYAPQLRSYVKQLNNYWNVSDGIGGYDVLPTPKPPDRYYDDNAWIVLALVEAHRLTGDTPLLERAIETQRFVMRGEDDKLGGGLYWREKDCQSKHTCSNAPGMVGALLLYQETGDAEQLADAKRLYAWTVKNLQDPADGLSWDLKRLDGRVDRRKYAYNSALMIRANSLLYEITGEDTYLKRAKRIARSSMKHWADQDTGAIRDAAQFSHLLVDAMFELSRVSGEASWRQVARTTVIFVHDKLRDQDGRYPGDWSGARKKKPGRFQLLHQASVARLYFSAAFAFSGKDASGEQGDAAQHSAG